MSKLVQHPHVASRGVEELVFVVTADNTVKTLNRAGGFLWQLLKQPHSHEELAAALSDAFDVTYEVALVDVQECMEDWLGRQMLVVAD